METRQRILDTFGVSLQEEGYDPEYQSSATLTRTLKDWDFAKPRISRSPEEAEALLSVIHRCFYEDFMEDADILEHLEQHHNTLLSARE